MGMAGIEIGRVGVGVALSALIGYVGYRRGALSASGWLGAVLVGTAMFGCGGWVAGLLLITFFISSSLLSHYRRAEKHAAAEKFAKGSRRDLGQALANGGVGALLSIGYGLWPDPLWLAGILGAMAAVTADTWGTELGVLSGARPRLVTTGRPVAPGTSGGVTWQGTGAGLVGALLIGLVAALLGPVVGMVGIGGQGWKAGPALMTLALGATAGLAGSLFDSLLGATVQGIYACDVCAKETEARVHRCGQPTRWVRGWSWLDNDLVNLIASGIGAGVAAGLLWALGG
jgi:uncharacterized protein (TIGR00297 family)